MGLLSWHKSERIVHEESESKLGLSDWRSSTSFTASEKDALKENNRVTRIKRSFSNSACCLWRIELCTWNLEGGKGKAVDVFFFFSLTINSNKTDGIRVWEIVSDLNTTRDVLDKILGLRFRAIRENLWKMVWNYSILVWYRPSILIFP